MECKAIIYKLRHDLILKLLFLLVVMFTLYAPIELTRVITLSWEYYGLLPELWFEIAFIWVLYVAAMILVWRLVCR